MLCVITNAVSTIHILSIIDLQPKTRSVSVFAFRRSGKVITVRVKVVDYGETEGMKTILDCMHFLFLQKKQQRRLGEMDHTKETDPSRQFDSNKQRGRLLVEMTKENLKSTLFSNTYPT